MIRANETGPVRSRDDVPSRHMPTVLLVEAARHDDRALYGNYLRGLALHTVEIDDTADALALAFTADVIVTDVLVPGPFDGLELVRRLRTDEQTSDKGVIVLTACSSEADEQRAYAAGCDGFLSKPCLPAALLAEIRRVMTSRSLQRV
jgi:CheY-like chemotaxis protein